MRLLHGNAEWHELSDEMPKHADKEPDAVLRDRLEAAMRDVATLRRQLSEMERYWRSQIARLTAEKATLKATLIRLGQR
jgi:hypothetical protein